MIETIKTSRDEVTQIKLSMVAGGLWDVKAAFPDVFGAEEVDDAIDMPEEHDADGNPIAVKYDFSNAEYDPALVEEQMREMAERAKASQIRLAEPGTIMEGEWL